MMMNKTGVWPFQVEIWKKKRQKSYFEHIFKNTKYQNHLSEKSNFKFSLIIVNNKNRSTEKREKEGRKWKYTKKAEKKAGISMLREYDHIHPTHEHDDEIQSHLRESRCKTRTRRKSKNKFRG